MSSFICDRNHIRYIVAATQNPEIFPKFMHLSWEFGDQHREVRHGDLEAAAKLGQMLWDENIRGVSHRYPGESTDTLPGPCRESFKFTERDVQTDRKIDPVQLLKSLSCLEYQSCDRPEFKDSEAAHVIERMRGSAICALKGYDRAEWGAPPYRRRAPAPAVVSL